MRVAKAVMWIGAVVLVAAGCGEPSNTGGTASPTNAYPTPGDKPLAGVNVGECISSSHVAQDLPGNVLSVTCPSPAAPYELAHKGLAEKGCPDAKAGDQGSAYARVTTTDRKTPTNPRPKSWVMCFALNMIPGQCYSEANSYFNSAPDCVSIGTVFRAVSQVADANGTCEPTQELYSWPVPQRTICLERVS
ncbi:hypothetical protein [Mycolicibacterium mageritense]|uniref:Lipoprotein LppU n=1 Tax=Mycolicibacterium mageritense TaxID=53462 RepID=A0AAI8TTG8_MYCME|nr:hypothetical protein [Mycolicibacterium mageritense]TXI62434.1 MAG: hypothetical protein E6Q55_13065 [Mycolicibacterium mageritense]BDY28247.1 hypothetical protein hbim_02178 [Mycolicibacterium mageritense]